MRKAILAGAAVGTIVAFLLWALEWSVVLPVHFRWSYDDGFRRFLTGLTAYGMGLYLVLGAVLGALAAVIVSPLRTLLPLARVQLRAALVPLILLAPTFWFALFFVNRWFLPHRSTLTSKVGNLFFLLLILALYAMLVWMANGLWSEVSRHRSRWVARTFAGGVWGLWALTAVVALIHWNGTRPRVGDIAPAGDRPNILFVIIETTRWDHVGCYGYDRNTTPNIDALAAEGVLFENFYTVAPISGISRAAFHTGVYPHHNGVRTHPQTIRPDRTLVAEIFRDAGYETGAFASGNMAGPEFGYHKGFRTYESWGTCYDQFQFSVAVRGLGLVLNMYTPWYKTRDERLALVDAGAGPARALEWIDGLEGAPFYIRFDLNEPHMTYIPPERFEKMFTEPYPEFDLVEESRGRYDIRYDFESTEFTQRDVEHAIGLYDAEIAYTDEAIGKLVQGLKERGLAENTIVIVTADHGESLGEHNLYFVHDQLYEQSLHVPLVMWAPGRLPVRRVQSVVNALDYYPTVLELAGLEPTGELEGHSLLGKLERDEPSGPIFAESNILMESRWTKYPHYRMTIPGVAGKWRMVRDGDYKLIYIPGPAGPEYELYDVRNDPAESINLAYERRDLFERLEPLLAEWMTQDERGNEDLDEGALADMQEQLRALGYIQ